MLVNTRNANAFTGKDGFKGLKILAEDLSEELTKKQNEDEDKPKKIEQDEILFACTGTIGESFPTEKIKKSIPELVKKINYTQNKYIWMKAALGIMTTDQSPKVAMEECKIGNTNVKIYGVAKGSGMIYPNMATTLGYIFTDADLSHGILQKLLKKNIETTFNAISCDGDTSTNDMVSIFSTGKAKHPSIKNPTDIKLKDFDHSLNLVLLNLAKRVAADGEGASKFITVNINNTKTLEDAKKIVFTLEDEKQGVQSLVSGVQGGFTPLSGRLQRLKDLLERCALDPNLSKEERDKILNNKLKKDDSSLLEAYTGRNGRVYEIDIIDVLDNTIDVPRRQAIAKDFRGIVVLRGQPSYSSNPQVLKDELKFRIDNQLP